MNEDKRDDLRATSESISHDAERLKAIEAQKRTLEPGDPGLEELAEEAERIGEDLAIKTKIETDIAHEVEDAPDA